MERLNLLSRVLAFLAALLTVAVSLLGVGPASAVAPHSTYDDAAYAYAASPRLSSQRVAAPKLRGSPAWRATASWGRSVADRDSGVATNIGTAVVPRVLTAAEQRSVASLQQHVATNAEKLAAYRANLAACDNLGILERAPTSAIRQQIIDGRIRHLQTEIRGFQNQIDKLLGGG